MTRTHKRFTTITQAWRRFVVAATTHPDRPWTTAADRAVWMETYA